MSQTRYIEPGWLMRTLFNPMVAALTGAGFSVWGSRVLQVRGRKSGTVRETPVNLLKYDGAQYLVAPRGETQWVRNLRAAGEGALRLGQRVERFRPVEITDHDKPPILRAYLRRWKAEVGVFFDGVSADSTEGELVRISSNHPVFRIEKL